MVSISPYFCINLFQIDKLFKDGEKVCYKSLLEKRLISKKEKIIRILAVGDITKKLEIEANYFSKAAIVKLEKKKIPFKLIKDKKIK